MNPKEQQFAQVVKDNRSTIYVVCYMFSNDGEEVADLFQEVLVKLWNGYDSFQGKSDIKTWIYRVTLNTCVTIDRKKRRRNRAMLSMDTPIRDKIAISCMLREIHEFSSHAIRHGLYIKNRKRLFCP